MFERRITSTTRRRAAMSGARWIFVAVALGSLLVLRPICVALAAQPAQAPAAHHHAAQASGGVSGSEEPECCAAHADALLANVVDTASGSVKNTPSVTLAGLALVLLFVAPISPAPRSRSSPGALERIRSYHARSARILR